MKLYLLRPVEDHPHWEPWYDKAFGFVVRAPDEAAARALAQADGGDEGGYTNTKPAWTEADMATCVEPTADGPAGVIIRDFWAA
jgi:pyocin large subunit-like protein